MITAVAERQQASPVTFRSGDLDVKVLAASQPKALNGYHALMTHGTGTYSTPRHHHTFDQIRLCLLGELTYGLNRKLLPGCVLFIAAGTFYGPQQDEGETMQYAIQYAGRGEGGFATKPEHAAALARLSAKGEFKNGLFSYTDADGKLHQQDGHEAMFEETVGFKLRYPQPLYHEPINIDPNQFAWLPSATPGIDVKQLIVLGSNTHFIRFVRLQPSTVYELSPTAGTRLFFVVEGDVVCEGAELGKHGHAVLEPGQAGAIQAISPTTILESGILY